MRHLDAEQYHELLNTKKLLVVEYSGATCAPCRILEDRLNNIEQDYPNAIFAKVYISDILNEAIDLGIMSTPTTILYSNGRAAMRFNGANAVDKVKSALDTLK